MKSPYERTGAKGSWQSIANWWYCSDCREMKNLPEHQISDDTNDYLSKDAADKFPTIARSRREFNAQYVDMLKLKEAVNEYQHKSKLPSLTTRNLMTGWLNEPAWICSHCGEFEFVAIDTFAYTIEEEMIS